MKKLEAELEEIKGKIANLKGEKEKLLETRNNVNMALSQVEVELLQLYGEQRLAEKWVSSKSENQQDDTSKDAKKGDNV